MHESYAIPIWAYSRGKFPGLGIEDREDCWGTVTYELLRKSREGRFHGNGSLLYLLRRMMDCRCADLLRKRDRDDQRRKGLGETLDEFGYPIHDLAPTIEVIEALMDEAIATLSDVPRMVWQAYRDTGYAATVKELVEILERIHPRPEGWTVKGTANGKSRGLLGIREYFRKRDGGNDRC